MKLRLLLLIKYCLFWLTYFATFRLIFYVFNFYKFEALPWIDFFLSFYYGLKLDLSIMGYLTILPAAMLLVSCFMENHKIIVKVVYYYTILVAFVVGFMLIADVKLYTYWDLKLDTEVFKYLHHLDQIKESVSFLDIVIPISVFLIIYFFWILQLKRRLLPVFSNLKKADVKVFALMTVFSGMLFFPIRGGVDLHPIQMGIPISASAAYFSENIFANHAALNPVWYFIDDYIKSKNKEQQHYHYLDDKVATKLVIEKMLHGTKAAEKVVNTDRPNLIFIIVESLTSNVIEVLGGHKGVTPQINKLCKEGMLFDNFYGTGTRSDKGLVSIFSGYPALPKESIMEFLNKCQQLPFLNRKLKEVGYETGFYYGGDLNFVNLGAYFKLAGTEHVVGRDDYPKEDWVTSWGVPDHIQLQRMLKDINENYRAEKNFFYSVFTINSHDPFDVPMKTVIKGDDPDHKFMNSVYYVDKSIGEFVTQAKKQPWWDNTLIVITADHGISYAHDAPRHEPVKFKIPMLWIGGALKYQDTIIHRIGTQTDIAATMLDQLNLDYSDFIYSKNLLAKDCPSYAFYTFNEGFGYVNDSLEQVYSFVLNTEIYKKGYKKEAVEEGKAYMQLLWQDYLQK